MLQPVRASSLAGQAGQQIDPCGQEGLETNVTYLLSMKPRSLPPFVTLSVINGWLIGLLEQAEPFDKTTRIRSKLITLFESSQGNLVFVL
jgi:hypothetical protein